MILQETEGNSLLLLKSSMVGMRTYVRAHAHKAHIQLKLEHSRPQSSWSFLFWPRDQRALGNTAHA